MPSSAPPSARQTLASGTIVGGRYRIVSELGRGGMGVVYVVEHVNTGGRLAMKLMLGGTAMVGDRAERFRREARASSRISSSHVVRVTDADTAPELDGAPYLVMELLDGVDLESRIKARGRLEPREVVDVLAQVARALDKAHAAGVIHRDLKPENVFLHRLEDGSEMVKVLDFGISKIFGRGDELAFANLTSSSELLGTPMFMAPEQATARLGAVGPATDVWAVGLLAVRMLTGSHYWTVDTLADLLLDIMNDERAPPSAKFPELTPELDAWFVKSCALEPAQRFPSVGAQVDALALALTGEPIERRGSIRPSDHRAPGEATPSVRVPAAPPAPVVDAPLGTSTAGPLTVTGPPRARPVRPIALGVAAIVVVGLAAALLARSASSPRGTAASPPPRACATLPPPASLPGAADAAP